MDKITAKTTEKPIVSALTFQLIRLEFLKNRRKEYMNTTGNNIIDMMWYARFRGQHALEIEIDDKVSLEYQMSNVPNINNYKIVN